MILEHIYSLKMHSLKINENIGIIGLRESFDDYKSLFPNFSNFIFMNQVHGDKIIDIRDSQDFTKFISNKSESDGLLVNKLSNKKSVIFIKTADCVPLVFEFNNNYFLIHAGWKGISLGIHKNIINFMNKEDLDSVKVYFGPHAINNYEVKSDVIKQIKKIRLNIIDDKSYFKMQDTIIADLLELGVKDINIRISKICTMSDANFYSHRLNNLEKMRNLMYVILK